MNRGELREYVLTSLDDLNAGYFTPAYVNLRLNLAMYEVQKLIVNNGQSWYVICKETTMIVNQQEYVLPEDFLKLSRLEVITSGLPPQENYYPLIPMTIMQQDMLVSTQGNPSNYFFKKNRIKVFPAPQNPYPLRMLYSYRVPPMNADVDIPDVPPQYQEMIAIYTVIEGLLRDGRSSAEWLAKKDEFKTMLREDAAQRHVDRSREIVYTGEYDSGTFGYW